MLVTKADILEQETAKMGRLDRLFRRYPQVQTTSFLSPPIKTEKNVIVFNPSWTDKVFVLIFILFAVITFIPLFNTLFTRQTPILIPIGGILFLVFIICVGLWFTFFDPNYLYQIRLTPNYIEAKNERHLWTDIDESYIMRKMEGRYENKYLILVKKDSTVIRLNLFKFRVHYIKLAGLIEFFRGNAA